jgi:hypothetical protein
MGRRLRISFLGRRRFDRFVLELKNKAADEWPQHLRSAWNILYDELSLPHSTALSIVINSASAADRFVKASNELLNDNVKAQAHTRIQTACSRVSKCAKRAPAALRRRLDQAIHPLLQEPQIDLEVMDLFFATTTKIFEEFSTVESSCVALRSLKDLERAGFSTLGMALGQKLEHAIAGFVATSSTKHQATAANAFAAMAAVLDSEEIARTHTQNGKLIIRYVTELARIWQDASLKPSRARDPYKPAYKSRFHRYADLVLTGMVEPRALRHDANVDEHRREIRRRHAELPADLRWVNPALRRADREWLISEDHIRRALQP